MYDLIVIGGGPAGLTAAIYAIRKRLNVLLISKDLGGKTNFHLDLPDQESYQVITGVDVVNKFKSELEYLKFARHMEPVVKVEKDDGRFVVHTKGGGELPARAVIIATGARQQLLDVPGEQEYLSKGLCYSALSYAPLFIDKDTVVIGEGELALRSAAELATVAHHVHVVGTSHEMLETPLGQKLVKADNVTVLEEYRVARVAGNGYCNKVIVQSPDGEKMALEADGTFVEKALVPNVEMVADLVERDELGFIKVDPYNRTSTPGVFAAGDVTNIYAEQVLVAVGEGVKAALSAYEYLLPML
ncbi:MAG TPA: FAD-dependent oxidoreductase [Anaerolineae bacterium]|nr:FAD-dependent oxidoreductase [Anaerolineae bacterium]